MTHVDIIFRYKSSVYFVSAGSIAKAGSWRTNTGLYNGYIRDNYTQSYVIAALNIIIIAA